MHGYNVQTMTTRKSGENSGGSMQSTYEGRLVTFGEDSVTKIIKLTRISMQT